MRFMGKGDMGGYTPGQTRESGFALSQKAILLIYSMGLEGTSTRTEGMQLMQREDPGTAYSAMQRCVGMLRFSQISRPDHRLIG
jgi:hypothetical protein